jgi:hypothetical protein
MEEEEEEPSPASHDESHNAEDEPESDRKEIRADKCYRIDYFSTQQWRERCWIRQREENRIVGTIITGEHCVILDVDAHT